MADDNSVVGVELAREPWEYATGAGPHSASTFPGCRRWSDGEGSPLPSQSLLRAQIALAALAELRAGNEPAKKVLVEFAG